MISERSFELDIPLKTVEDLIAAHLYAVGYVLDNEDVDIQGGAIDEDFTNMHVFGVIKKEVN